MLPYNTYLEMSSHFSGVKMEKILELLALVGLEYDPGVTMTAAVFDQNGDAIATASLEQNIFKCIAVSPEYQGEGMTSALFSALIPYCIKNGYQKQFLYTKKGNRSLFSPFGFALLGEGASSILMERPAGGLKAYLDSLSRPRKAERIGAIVAHCNPLTNGHLYLMEQALAQCDFLYVFILSEDKGMFPAADRIALVRQALKGREGCAICPTDQYMISAATFPSYFLHDQAVVRKEWCEMDARMFACSIAPALGITVRFVGTEPFSPITSAYNSVLKEILPQNGISLAEIPRLTEDNTAISASAVRALLKKGRLEEIRPLVPDCTWEYLKKNAPA